MKSWIACWSCSILFLSLFLFLQPASSCSQSLDKASLGWHPQTSENTTITNWRSDFIQDTTRKDPSPNLPDPKSVMYKSMIVPGWGQIVNKQWWKVPIIYGMLAGLGYYSVYLTKRYHDYRAAYYNKNPEIEGDDLRFGRTPSYIPDDANLDQLKSLRNTYHNRRDLIYVATAVAYGLNIVDAYVFAHLRSFDVSDDLSMRTSIKPGIMAQAAPGFTLSIDLMKK